MKLKSIAEIRTGLATARKKATVLSDCYNYKSINMKVFNNDTTLSIEYLDVFKSKEKITLQYLTQENDILIRLREPNHTIHISKNDTELLIPSIIGIIRLKDRNINSRFLAFYLNSTTIKRQLTKHKQGNSIITTNTKDIENLEISLPPLSQQNKINNMMKLANQELNLIENLKITKQKYYSKVFNNLVENGASK